MTMGGRAAGTDESPRPVSVQMAQLHLAVRPGQLEGAVDAVEVVIPVRQRQASSRVSATAVVKATLDRGPRLDADPRRRLKIGSSTAPVVPDRAGARRPARRDRPACGRGRESGAIRLILQCADQSALPRPGRERPRRAVCSAARGRRRHSRASAAGTYFRFQKQLAESRVSQVRGVRGQDDFERSWSVPDRAAASRDWSA